MAKGESKLEKLKPLLARTKKLGGAPILYGILAFCSLFIAYTLASNLYLSRDLRVEQALKKGQRIEIDIKTGKNRYQEKPAPAAAKTVKPAPLALAEEKADPNKPYISIVIGGLGLSKTTTEAAAVLPKEITFSFSPYSFGVEEIVAKYITSGRQILVDLPLEPEDYPLSDPGNLGFLSKFPKEKNTGNLAKVAAKFDKIAGLAVMDPEKLTVSPASDVLIDALAAKHLTVVYGSPAINPSFIDKAALKGVRVTPRDVIIDAKISKSEIEENLKSLEEIARKNGKAVGIGRPYPVTIKAVSEWASSLKAKGIELRPAVKQ